MKILLTGRNGMVGWELNRSLLPLGEVIALDREGADLSRPEGLRKIVADIQPDVIVNAAAYTAVDRAEEEEELATVINGTAPGVLAEEAKKCGALLVHYSTDYVFDGTKDGPYLETDIPNPLNAYGRSKLAGEKAIQESGADYLVFRTSWVYAARGQNFLLTMLRLMQEREVLNVVADQVGAPTWARTIADATAHCLKKVMTERNAGASSAGLYHLSSSGATSWHGFACLIANVAEQLLPADTLMVMDVEKIKKIKTEDFKMAACRPASSVLSSRKLEQQFVLEMPSWNQVVERCIEDLTAR